MIKFHHATNVDELPSQIPKPNPHQHDTSAVTTDQRRPNWVLRTPNSTDLNSHNSSQSSSITSNSSISSPRYPETSDFHGLKKEHDYDDTIPNYTQNQLISAKLGNSNAKSKLISNRNDFFRKLMQISLAGQNVTSKHPNSSNQFGSNFSSDNGDSNTGVFSNSADLYSESPLEFRKNGPFHERTSNRSANNLRSEDPNFPNKLDLKHSQSIQKPVRLYPIKYYSDLKNNSRSSSEGYKPLKSGRLQSVTTSQQESKSNFLPQVEQRSYSSHNTVYDDEDEESSQNSHEPNKAVKIVPFSSVFFTKGADLGRNRFYQIAHVNKTKSSKALIKFAPPKSNYKNVFKNFESSHKLNKPPSKIPSKKPTLSSSNVDQNHQHNYNDNYDRPESNSYKPSSFNSHSKEDERDKKNYKYGFGNSETHTPNSQYSGEVNSNSAPYESDSYYHAPSPNSSHSHPNSVPEGSYSPTYSSNSAEDLHDERGRDIPSSQYNLEHQKYPSSPPLSSNQDPPYNYEQSPAASFSQEVDYNRNNDASNSEKDIPKTYNPPSYQSHPLNQKPAMRNPQLSKHSAPYFGNAKYQENSYANPSSQFESNPPNLSPARPHRHYQKSSFSSPLKETSNWKNKHFNSESYHQEAGPELHPNLQQNGAPPYKTVSGPVTANEKPLPFSEKDNVYKGKPQFNSEPNHYAPGPHINPYNRPTSHKTLSGPVITNAKEQNYNVINSNEHRPVTYTHPSSFSPNSETPSSFHYPHSSGASYSKESNYQNSQDSQGQYKQELPPKHDYSQSHFPTQKPLIRNLPPSSVSSYSREIDYRQKNHASTDRYQSNRPSTQFHTSPQRKPPTHDYSQPHFPVQRPLANNPSLSPAPPFSGETDYREKNHDSTDRYKPSHPSTQFHTSPQGKPPKHGYSQPHFPAQRPLVSNPSLSPAPPFSGETDYRQKNRENTNQYQSSYPSSQSQTSHQSPRPYKLPRLPGTPFSGESEYPRDAPASLEEPGLRHYLPHSYSAQHSQSSHNAPPSSASSHSEEYTHSGSNQYQPNHLKSNSEPSFAPFPNNPENNYYQPNETPSHQSHNNHAKPLSSSNNVPHLEVSSYNHKNNAVASVRPQLGTKNHAPLQFQNSPSYAKSPSPATPYTDTAPHQKRGHSEFFNQYESNHRNHPHSNSQPQIEAEYKSTAYGNPSVNAKNPPTRSSHPRSRNLDNYQAHVANYNQPSAPKSHTLPYYNHNENITPCSSEYQASISAECEETSKQQDVYNVGNSGYKKESGVQKYPDVSPINSPKYSYNIKDNANTDVQQRTVKSSFLGNNNSRGKDQNYNANTESTYGGNSDPECDEKDVSSSCSFEQDEVQQPRNSVKSISVPHGHSTNFEYNSHRRQETSKLSVMSSPVANQPGSVNTDNHHTMNNINNNIPFFSGEKEKFQKNSSPTSDFSRNTQPIEQYNEEKPKHTGYTHLPRFSTETLIEESFSETKTIPISKKAMPEVVSSKTHEDNITKDSDLHKQDLETSGRSQNDKFEKSNKEKSKNFDGSKRSHNPSHFKKRSVPDKIQTAYSTIRNSKSNARQDSDESDSLTSKESDAVFKDMPDVDMNESEESFGQEDHDGFLDMGAYTDKNGSFGWYADFPVGKSHDKLTWSFS
ncbi:homeobox protein 2-like [Parasteatoda tepidariorum]|uniref:homeobox protein 2-like n=1 Tax=Parasteatoda tepidariorum TaxID=114398 RepID=UPI001C72648F|nr:transcription factor mef2A-like [Parasteatoda tepidariorum]